jgi:hypothetical protein
MTSQGVFGVTTCLMMESTVRSKERHAPNTIMSVRPSACLSRGAGVVERGSAVGETTCVAVAAADSRRARSLESAGSHGRAHGCSHVPALDQLALGDGKERKDVCRGDAEELSTILGTNESSDRSVRAPAAASAVLRHEVLLAAISKKCVPRPRRRGPERASRKVVDHVANSTRPDPTHS